MCWLSIISNANSLCMHPIYTLSIPQKNSAKHWDYSRSIVLQLGRSSSTMYTLCSTSEKKNRIAKSVCIHIHYIIISILRPACRSYNDGTGRNKEEWFARLVTEGWIQALKKAIWNCWQHWCYWKNAQISWYFSSAVSLAILSGLLVGFGSWDLL